MIKQLTFMALWVAVSAFGHEAVPMRDWVMNAPSPADTALGHENALLWRISGNGLSKPSYLFGLSSWALGSYVELRAPRVATLLNETEGVMGELEYNDAQMKELGSIHFFGSPTSLKDALNAREHKMLGRLIESSMYGKNLNVVQLDKASPLFIVDLLCFDQLTKRFPKDMTGSDKSLIADVPKRARKAGKAYHELETKSATLAISRQSMADAAAELRRLKAYLVDTAIAHKRIRTMFGAYVSGDLATCAREYAAMGEPNLSPQRMALRQADWLKQMPALLRSQSWLVTVNPLFLAGPNGLVIALRKVGYTVTPEPLR